MAVPEPPMSFIFDNARFDEDDPEMKSAYDMLMISIQGMTEIEIHNQIQATASISMIKHSEIINGLLYGILTYNTNPNNNNNSNSSNNPGGQNNPTPSDLFRHMNFVARDSLAYAVKQTRYFSTLVNFHKIRPQVREQLLWLVGQLTEIRVHGVEHLYMALLKQIRGGDVSQSNVQHAEAMLRLLQAHLTSWVYSIPALIAHSCFTYLRIMLDHGRFGALRQQEAMFCAKLLRERFRDCSDVGRDLVRALQDVARIKEIEEIWVDLLHSPEKLNPQLEGVHQLMAMPSKDIYLASRLTFDMEHKLLHILKYINVGQHHRNLQWFIDRYLSAPETDALFCDVIRYICGVYHPTNAVLASSIVPRYVIIGGLVRFIKTNVAAANVKLALFYDWLFYDPSKDSIMNIEPAMLLMERSVERYPYITSILLEFLHFTVENYYPPLREYIHKHVGMAAQAIVEKGVIRSFRFIYKSPSLDDYPPIREYMVSMFPTQLGDIAEGVTGFTAGVGASMESTDDSHSPTQSTRDTDNNEGVDEFESSPPHSGFIAQGIAGQDGEEEDDEQDRKDLKSGRKSRTQSRESSREPMAIDDLTPTLKDEDDEAGEDEVMETSVVEQQPQQQPRLHNPSVLSEWTFTEDDAMTKGSGKDGDSDLAAATPIPGASLWIFGSSLQEFKNAYESDPEAPGAAKMFKNIWEVYGDVAGAGVDGTDIAQEIGKEICAFAKKAEIPDSYVTSASIGQSEDAGVMEALMSCLWKVTERDGKDGALRVAQMFLKSEIAVDPGSRLLGMWYLLGLVRGQNRKSSSAGITREQALQLYGSYIRASVKQDQADRIEEDGREEENDPSYLGQEYLLRDLQQLQDRQSVVFESVLPMVLQYLPELIPRTETFLQLVLSMATPAQIYRLSMGLTRRDFWLLSTPVPLSGSKEDDEEETRRSKNTRNSKKKGTTQVKLETNDALSLSEGWEPKVTSQTLKVLSRTLDWETYDQLGLWQLVVSEVGGVSEAVTTLLTASWIPSLNTQAQAEALGGLLNLVRTLILSPPDVKLGRAIVKIASQTDIISTEMRRFCEANFAQWARRYPDHLAAIVLSLSDKNAAPVATTPSDGDVEMEDVTQKNITNKGGSKNTRAKNNTTSTKLSPKQRKEQAIQLRAALSLLQVWWESNGLSSLSPSSTAKQLFSKIWSQQVKTQVQDALVETFGLNEKNSWPKDWWVSDEEESKSRRKGGRRDVTSDDDDERSQDEDEINGDDRSDDDDDNDDDRPKKNEVDQDSENDQEQSSDDDDRRGKEKKRFGGAAGSGRRNSPKVNSGVAFNSSNGSRKGSLAGSAAAGILNSKSRGKNSPTSTKKAPAKKGAGRKRKISDDEDEEEDEDENQDDDEEEEEEEAEDMEEEEEEEEEDGDDDDEDDERGSKSKKGKPKQPAKKVTKAASTKTRSSSRNKAKPVTRNGRKKLKGRDKDDEEESEDEESADDEEDEGKDQEEDEEEQDDENEDEDGDEESEEDENDKSKQTMYVSQRRAAASANSKLMTSSSSPTNTASKSKAAAAKRRGKLKRQIISEDESDE
ncbi:Integrator complex subunit 3 [Haplosporangium sp. Z 27]|nr:Integrator complex subunit 3 [Haplosporangium sp. Z 27]